MRIGPKTGLPTDDEKSVTTTHWSALRQRSNARAQRLMCERRKRPVRCSAGIIDRCSVGADNQMTDYSDRYRNRVLDPDAWRQTGQQLLDAAELIAPQVDIFWEKLRSGVQDASSWRGWNDEFVAIYFMLAAFALENLLKAHIVAIQREELEQSLAAKACLPKLLRSHDLHELAIKAGFIEVASEEEQLLRSLTRSSEWYGRYPTPTSAADLDPVVESRHGTGGLSRSAYNSKDRDNVRRLAREFGASNRALQRTVARSARPGR